MSDVKQDRRWWRQLRHDLEAASFHDNALVELTGVESLPDFGRNAAGWEAQTTAQAIARLSEHGIEAIEDDTVVETSSEDDPLTIGRVVMARDGHRVPGVVEVNRLGDVTIRAIENIVSPRVFGLVMAGAGVAVVAGLTVFGVSVLHGDDGAVDANVAGQAPASSEPVDEPITDEASTTTTTTTTTTPTSTTTTTTAAPSSTTTTSSTTTPTTPTTTTTIAAAPASDVQAPTIIVRGDQVFLEGVVNNEQFITDRVSGLGLVFGPENVNNNLTFDPAGPSGAEGTEVIFEDSVLFGFASAELDPAYHPVLDRLALFAGQLNITVSGHTDDVGTDENNQALSERRAQAVADYLIAQGAPAENIVAVGYGESQPVADNATEAGRQVNRRIDIDVTQP